MGISDKETKLSNPATRYDTELRVDPNICCKEKEDEDLWLYQECAWKIPRGNFFRKIWTNGQILVTCLLNITSDNVVKRSSFVFDFATK